MLQRRKDPAGSSFLLREYLPLFSVFGGIYFCERLRRSAVYSIDTLWTSGGCRINVTSLREKKHSCYSLSETQTPSLGLETCFN